MRMRRMLGVLLSCGLGLPPVASGQHLEVTPYMGFHRADNPLAGKLEVVRGDGANLKPFGGVLFGAVLGFSTVKPGPWKRYLGVDLGFAYVPEGVRVRLPLDSVPEDQPVSTDQTATALFLSAQLKLMFPRATEGLDFYVAAGPGIVTRSGEIYEDLDHVTKMGAQLSAGALADLSGRVRLRAGFNNLVTTSHQNWQILMGFSWVAF